MSAPARIRPAVAEDALAIAQVRVDAWRATYRGMMPDACLDAMSVEENAGFWRRILAAASPLASVYVAQAGPEIVGFASGSRRDPPKLGFDAELAAVYLRADWKRRGLGRRLVAAIAAAERAKGANGLVAFVIAGNSSARAFYDNLGAELLLEQPFEWDGIALVEAAYGGRDLSALVAAGNGAAQPTLPHPSFPSSTGD